MKKPIIFVVGPTAVGKTQVGHLLCRRLKGEVVSCDSMQVYREISIATSKPSVLLRQEIPYHLVDVISVQKNFNVAQYFTLAQRAIAKIHKNNKIPVVVGGTGLYMTVLLDGIFTGEVGNEKVREELMKEIREKGRSPLYQELKKVDPQAAGKIHPHDERRIIRALEVFRATGIPISQMQKNRKGLWGEYPIKIFAISCEREKLYERINNRVEKMFRQGIVKEIASLRNLSWSQTAKAILGYKEIMGLLAQQYSMNQAKEMLQRNTRRFAKRQLTWFRREKRLEWIDIGNRRPFEVAEKIWQKLKEWEIDGTRSLSRY